MDIELVDAGPDFTNIALSGRVTLDEIGDLDHEFTRQTVVRRKPVLVDLSKVDFMASIGLRILITAAKALSKHNAKMVLYKPQPEVEKVLKTSGFDNIMPIEHDFEKAVQLLTN